MKATLKAVGTGILLAQMVISLVTLNIAFAADYYVDAANGNNAWTGISPTPGAPNGPKKNIYDGAGGNFSALEIPGLTSGDTIHVAAGTYDRTNHGEVFPYDFQALGLPDGLRIRGADPATTKVFQDDPNIMGAWKGAFYFNGGSATDIGYTNDTRVESLTITNVSGPGIRMEAGNGGTASPTIAGCTITECDTEGIVGDWWFAGSTTAVMHPVISACTVTDNTEEGIEFYNANSRMIDLDVTIKNCTVTDNDLQGVRVLARGTDARAVLTVNPSTVSGNGSDGVYFKVTSWASGSATLSGNTIHDNDGEGVYLDAADFASLAATIEGNTISNNSGPGIYIYMSDDATGTCTITGNPIRDNEDHGIRLYVFDGSTLAATIGNDLNTITGNEGNGIDLWALTGVITATIKGNTVTDNDYDGMEMNASVTGTLNLTVSGNTVTDNGYNGLALNADNNSTLSGVLSWNTIEENGFNGIVCEAVAHGSTASPTIDGNTIRFNGMNGIELGATSVGDVCSPVIENNWIQANGGHGVSLSDNAGGGTCNPDLGWGAGSSAGNNWITDNYGEDTGGMTRFYELYCMSHNPPTGTVYAKGNYWGASLTADIGLMIYDSVDQAGLSTVDYANYVNSVTTVLPVSGWYKAYVVAAGTDSTANTWTGVIYDTAGDLKGSFGTFAPPVNGIFSTWDIYGNVYSVAKPLGNWNMVGYDADLFAGMWQSSGGVPPEGWGWYAPTSFRAKGTEFVIPMSGWTVGRVYLASAKTPGVTTGTMEIYDQNGDASSGPVYTGNFTLPHFGAVWKSNALVPNIYDHAKPAVVRIVTDRDVTVGTGQYKPLKPDTAASAGGWGSEVYPISHVTHSAAGTNFVFPANGWNRCWFEVANVSGAAVSGTVTVYDATGTQQGAAIPIAIANPYGYWRSAPTAIYALARPAVVRIATDNDVVVRHARYTTSGGLAGWGYSVLPTTAQEGPNFEFAVRGWSNAFGEIVNTSGGAITATVTVYDKSGTPVAGPTVSPPIPNMGYTRTWDILPGNLYAVTNPVKVTIAPTGDAVVTANCWTSTASGKAGWAWGVLPH